MHGHDLLLICGIVAAGFVCQWLAWRLRLPSILFLLATGIAAGPVFGVLDPDALFGDLLVTIVSVAVAIILFEGSLTLRLGEIRGHGSVVRNLVSVGVLVTWVVSGLAAYFFLGWDAYLSALFGAIVTVSGPTVIMPLLRTVRPQSSVASILRWESILIDPLGAILGILVFDFIVAAQTGGGAGHALTTVVVMVVAGGTLGAIGGHLLGMALRARKVPDFLRDYAGLAAVLTVFAAAEAVRGESGLLAVTVMGIWLGNMKDVDIEDVLSFKESLTLVLVAALFIVLAARLDIGNLYGLGWGAVAVFAAIQFVGGPLRALVSSAGSALSMRERLFLGWVFPRGIVAAAISALFSLRLEELGQEGAASLVPLVFMIIIGTVVLQSLSAKVVARGLDVAEPPPTGVLIIGANQAAIEIAVALKEAGLRVLVTDTHWAGIGSARMRGLDTFFGSAVSGYADDNLELTGLGNLLAMSRRPGLNELACVRFANDFGRDHVYTVRSVQEGEHGKYKVSGESIGRVLYEGQKTVEELVQRVRFGDSVTLTELSEEFTFRDYLAQNPENLVIATLSPDQVLCFPVADKALEPAEGWKIVALRRDQAEKTR